MIDTYFHNGSTNNNNYDSFDSYLTKYKNDKPNFKSIIWNNYDRLKEIDDSGQTRETILDNIQRTLLCKTVYLG